MSDPRTLSWNRSMAASPGDLDLEVPSHLIDGKIPAALFGGRLLSNGPGWTRIGDRTAHPFDGHGYVRAFSFDDTGAVRLKARFVRTPSFLEEEKEKRLVVRGFATNRAGPFWKNLGIGPPRNVANTTIFRVGDRLIAGWEAGRPYALDATTLETIGEEDFGGALADQASLAHFHYDTEKDRLVSASLETGRQTHVTFREFDSSGQLQTAAAATLDGMLLAHDFAISPSWNILAGSKLKVRPREMAKMLLGASTLLRSVQPDVSAPGTLHLVPRDPSQAVRTIALPGPAFVVHFGNAFERDGDVIVDACLFPRFDLGQEFGYTGPDSDFDPTLPDARGPQRLMRITVPAGSDVATWRPLCEHGVDFPRFHPAFEAKPAPTLFGATRKDPRFSDPFDSILAKDLVDEERPPTLWTTPENTFVGEPIFVPAAPDATTEGFVLALVSDGLREQTTLVVLDAQDFERGPVASVPLPLLPVAFHGDWDADGTN